MISVTLVGCGRVSVDRILPAARLLADEGLLSVSHLVDVVPRDQLALAAGEALGEDPIYHQISPQPGALAKLIAQKHLGGTPFIVATPTPWHSQHACEALAAGCPVALEKPLGSTPQHLKQLSDCLADGGDRLLFPLGYYLIEKGLPLLALARDGALTPAQLRCLDGVQPAQWAQIRDELGPIKSITGLLREGCDPRAWVQADEAGGHTLETFSHLVALALPAVGDLELVNAVLGYADRNSGTATESIIYAEFLGLNGQDVRLGCQKGSPASLCERWFRIDYERGCAVMDLEHQVLSIDICGRSFVARVLSSLKYEPQLRMFVEKLVQPDTPTEYEIGRRSVLASIAVREAALRVGRVDLPDNWLNSRFSRKAHDA